MPGPTEQELDAALGELKQAIADCAARVLAKIAALIAAQPDLTDELTDIRDDMVKLAEIAPNTEPTP